MSERAGMIFVLYKEVGAQIVPALLECIAAFKRSQIISVSGA
jgi:hypothetical protein